jgi:phage terminase Nu1 subunit (DNA packaging protein)
MPKMSIAEYSRHRGVSDMAVHRAINEGRITLHSDKLGKRYIDSEVADREWYANTDSAFARGEAAKSALERTADELFSEDGSEVGESEDAEAGARKKTSKKRVKKAPAEEGVGIRKDLDSARAKRESYQAELARLKYEEQAGKLIDAEAVQNEAFKIARTVRDALMNLPDRVAAEFAGETNQFRIHTRLSEEIRKALVAIKENYGSE